MGHKVERITEFGKLTYDSETGRILWAENNVWENLPHLISGDTFYYASPDGYLLEPTLNTCQNPHNKRVQVTLKTIHDSGDYGW
jgi:hypothetical protein